MTIAGGLRIIDSNA